MTFVDKLFSFRGRITRLDYWLFTIGLIVIIIAAFLAEGYALGILGRLDENMETVMIFATIGVFLWPIWAVGVKRCHDLDKSGWWFAGWTAGGFIPYLGVVINLWALAELGFLDGTQGANQFGPSPKGIGTDHIPDIFA